MAQQQRQQYGRQTDEYGNEIHQTEQYENPLNSGGGGELRTAGYGGEHGTTGGGYRGTQYGTTEFGGGRAGYGGGHGTTGGGFSGTQYGTTDIGGGKGHETGGGMQNKPSDVGGGGHGAVVGGYSTTGGEHQQYFGSTGTGIGAGDTHQEHSGSTGTGIGTGAGAALGLGGRPHYGKSGSGRHHGEHQDQYQSGIGLGRGHQEGEMMRGGHRGHDEQPAVTTTTTTIATGVSYEQEGPDEERGMNMIDKVLDKVPGFH